MFGLFFYKYLGFKTILVRRTGAVGDVLLTTPLICELKKRFPKSYLIVCTGCQEVFKNNPYVDKLTSNFEKFEKKVEVVIDLDLCYERKPSIHVVDAYFEKAFNQKPQSYQLELYPSKKDEKNLVKKINKLSFTKKPWIVMHQALSWENRTWPQEFWDELAKKCVDAGYQVITIGQSKDFSTKDPGVVDLRKRLTLQEIKLVVERSKAFIGIDSALFHVAQTSKAPVFGIFTIADPKLRITRKEKTYPFSPNLPCRFCLHRQIAPITHLTCPIVTPICTREMRPDLLARKLFDVLEKGE